jgi:hypothetical protein
MVGEEAKADCLPFGSNAGRPLSELTDDYLRWTAGVLKDGNGLYQAVVGELARRGIAAPPGRPRRRLACSRCGTGAPVACRWYEDALKRMHVRGTCATCGRPLGFLPQTPGNVAAADAAKGTA